MINKDFNFEPVCQVSVKNVIHNVKYVLDNLNGEKLIAVVKSNAYGHGLKLCPFIEKYVDCFAVSRWQEALSLRYMGVSKLKLCKINNTIPYEILANISPRIKREYVDIYESDWW